MKSTKQAEMQMKAIADELSAILKGSSTIDTVREDKDSNAWPMIFLSDGGVETTTNPVIALRMKAVDAVSKDVFGNDLIAFGPHSLEFAYEDAVPALIDIATVMAPLGKHGINIQVKVIAASTAVTATSMDAKAVDKEIAPLLRFPTKGV
jgi:hypothetical protein